MTLASEDEMDSGDDGEKMDDPELISFELNEKGLPVLPPIPKDSKPMRPIFRSYITWFYRRFTNNTKARVPWKTLNQEFNEYLDSDCFPPYFVIEDPSHMLKKDFLACFATWQATLDEGIEEPVRFLKALDEHMIEPSLIRPATRQKSATPDEEDELNYLSSSKDDRAKLKRDDGSRQVGKKRKSDKRETKKSKKAKNQKTRRGDEASDEELSDTASVCLSFLG